MTVAVGIVVGIVGLALIVIGLGFFIVFRFGIRVFDQSLKSDIAAQGSEQVERAAMRIRNPFVRRFVMEHMVKTGGTVAVAVVRGALQSRMRTGLWMAVAGVGAVISAFYAGSWLPLIWKAA